MVYRPIIPETLEIRLKKWYASKVRGTDTFRGVTFADVLDDLLKEVGY